MPSTNASNVEGGRAAWLDRWEAFADDASGRLLDRVIGPKPDPVKQVEQAEPGNGLLAWLKANGTLIAVTVVGGALAIWLARKFLR